jgi:hypothetical protein
MGTHPLTDGAQDSTENLAKSSRPHEGLLFCFNSRMRGSCLYFQWVWQGQVHPGRLQSLCRSLSLEGLAQNEEVSGGQVPRGYPRQEVPVGPGVVSGMCLTTDIPVRGYQPRNRPVCSRMLTFLAAIGSGMQWACVPQTSVSVWVSYNPSPGGEPATGNRSSNAEHKPHCARNCQLRLEGKVSLFRRGQLPISMRLGSWLTSSEFALLPLASRRKWGNQP